MEAVLLLQFGKSDFGSGRAFERTDLPQFSPQKLFLRIAEQILHERIGVHHLPGAGVENQDAVQSRFIEPPVPKLRDAYRFFAPHLRLLTPCLRLFRPCLGFFRSHFSLFCSCFRLLDSCLCLFDPRLGLFRPCFGLLRPRFRMFKPRIVAWRIRIRMLCYLICIRLHRWSCIFNR